MQEYILLDNIIFESSTSESSLSDNNDNELLNIEINNNNNERKIPKIRNYIEYVVALYTDVEFKSHFRFVYILFVHKKYLCK